jgi:HD-GYP domain-containing protein (c-di-GMP phosphodiesterase class II)
MRDSYAQEFLEFLDQGPAVTVRSLTARVLTKCRELTRAQAGTIFIVRGKGAKRRLEAVHTQNDAIFTESTVFVVPVDTGSISGFVATTGENLFVDNVDTLPPSLPFKFNRSYDLRTGYTTKSMLCFPLVTPEEKIIGVVQLINCVEDGKIVPFDRQLEGIIAPASNIAGRIIERMVAHEEITQRNIELEKRNKVLKQQRAKIVALSAETERAFMSSVELLARAAEKYDETTGEHVKRVSEYSAELARLAGHSQHFCAELRWAAKLHDIGKMSIDHSVLNKRGRLDDREFAEMARHTTLGYEILAGYPRLAMAAEIAHAHHEMWAGGGYPRRLKGEEIPLEARIVSIVDVYDALRSTRPYKLGFSHERTVSIIVDGDDRLRPELHFDPKLMAVFRENHQHFAAIWDRLADDVPMQQLPELPRSA